LIKVWGFPQTFFNLNPKYALDFLLRVQTAAKSIALLHLAQSP